MAPAKEGKGRHSAFAAKRNRPAGSEVVYMASLLKGGKKRKEHWGGDSGFALPISRPCVKKNCLTLLLKGEKKPKGQITELTGEKTSFLGKKWMQRGHCPRGRGPVGQKEKRKDIAPSPRRPFCSYGGKGEKKGEGSLSREILSKWKGREPLFSFKERKAWTNLPMSPGNERFCCKSIYFEKERKGEGHSSRGGRWLGAKKKDQLFHFDREKKKGYPLPSWGCRRLSTGKKKKGFCASLERGKKGKAAAFTIPPAG